MEQHLRSLYFCKYNIYLKRPWELQFGFIYSQAHCAAYFFSSSQTEILPTFSEI